MPCLLILAACSQPAARNLVLISIDTLRPDHLGVYGYERPTSPKLDAFAARGVVFENALSTAPWTLPAHVSLLTGRYPAHHGVRTDLHTLRRELPTLAEWLRRREFETAAFYNTHFLQPRSGLQRGFDPHEYVPESNSREGDAARITRLALDWLEARRGERFFLFLHYFDPHSDYVSQERYEQSFAPGPGRLSGRTGELMEVRAGLVRLGAGDVEHLKGLYDAALRQLDDDLAPLLAWLEETGRLDDTVVAVTSDHGEEFLEHGGVLHDHTHYEELLRVPLILRGARLPAGMRVPGAVSLVDVMPTLLGLLGVRPPPDMDGRDLSALWESPASGSDVRALYAETSPLREDALSSVRVGRHKLIHDRRTGRVELYDLEADPGESRDLSGERRDLLEILSAELEVLRGSATRPQAAPPSSEEREERLRALGYL